MILILLVWVLVTMVFFVMGYSIEAFLNKISARKETLSIKPDEAFFIGFLSLSAISGILSIFFPMGIILTVSAIVLSVLLFLINLKQFKNRINIAVKSLLHLRRWEFFLLLFIIFFILSYVANTISLYDTQMYHAQSIQWIRKYAVVPGLGNIHGRLAFNSMFFVISGLLSFQIKDILIFPLNSLCYIVLIIKLFILYKKENKPGTRWKSVFYILTLLISLLMIIPDLNTPSSDIICCILVMYVFVSIIDRSGDASKLCITHIVLLNLVVFSCITFKISSLFLILTLLFLVNKQFVSNLWISIFIGTLVFSSFLIRNYYLSGYLIYPFPAIDIFHADWKIPFDDVLSMKLEIESWAKISSIPYPEVLNMKISEWILPWFKTLNFNSKMLMTVNLFSIVILVVMFFKKDFFLAKIQLIILLNLIFWFIKAPDLRFAYGFLFLGFSLNFAYLLKQWDSDYNSGLFSVTRILLTCFLIIVISRRIMVPFSTLKDSRKWLLPESFGTVMTTEYKTDFSYRVPENNDQCFNAEIPCVPYPLSNIVLRGSDLQDGFKYMKQTP